MSSPRGQGRNPSLRERRRQSDRANEAVIAAACMPSAAPRPAWWDRPDLLPKKPPTARKGEP